MTKVRQGKAGEYQSTQEQKKPFKATFTVRRKKKKQTSAKRSCCYFNR